MYAEEGWETRKAAERAAVTRIFGMLPEPQGAPLLAVWQEFEEGETPEARFAHAADRAMPVLLNLANKGQSWRENETPGSARLQACWLPHSAATDFRKRRPT